MGKRKLARHKAEKAAKKKDKNFTSSLVFEGKASTKKAKRLVRHKQLLKNISAKAKDSAKDPASLSGIRGLSGALRLVLDDSNEEKNEMGAHDIAKQVPVEHQHQAGGHPGRAKTRKKTMKREVEQFTAVLDHPSFRNDPISTLRKHLSNTIPQS